MPNDETVTQWLREFQAGNSNAAQEIWEHYYERLMRFASQKIPNHHRRIQDEDDVVLSAFDSLFRGVKENKFPKLENRGDLWKLLLVITARKTIDHSKWIDRKKRGGGRVRGESWFHSTDNDDELNQGFAQVLARNPTAEFAVQFGEQYAQLLDSLDDETLRTVAQLKLEGYLNHEIAKEIDCSERTIDRKLWVIRSKWSRFLKPEA